MTIEISPQLEIALASEASRQGTTPQALAVTLIESQLLRPDTNPTPVTDSQEGSAARTLYERWRGHLEAIQADAAPRTGPTNLSQDTGRRFAELLQQKRLQNRS